MIPVINSATATSVMYQLCSLMVKLPQTCIACDPLGENLAISLTSREGYGHLRTLKKALDRVDQRPVAMQQMTQTEGVFCRLKNCMNCGS